MAANHFGLAVDITAIRDMGGSSARGTTALALTQLAAKLGLRSRAVRVEPDQLRELRYPAILHWDMNHFVVMSGLKRGKAQILDPAAGHLALSLQGLNRHFTGTAIELWPIAPDFPLPITPIRRVRLADFISGWRILINSLATLLLLTTLTEGIQLAVPAFTNLVVERIIPTQDIALLATLAGAYTFGAILVVIFRLAQGRVETSIGIRLARDASDRIFAHVLRLPYLFFQKRLPADIMSRFSGLYQVQDLLVNSSVRSILDTAFLIGATVLMFIYSPPLGTIALMIVGTSALIRGAFFGKYQRCFDLNVRRTSEENSFLLETLRGILAIKAASLESHRGSDWRNVIVSRLEAQRALSRFAYGFKAVSDGFGALGLVVLVSVGAIITLDGNLQPGGLIASLLYFSMFYSRANAVLDTVTQWRRVRVEVERVGDILRAPVESDSSGPVTRLDVKGEIEGVSLGFKYETSGPYVFRGFSFRLDAGQTVGVVGPSGVGKSTLIKILLGLLEPAEGQVLVDSKPLRKHSLRSYRNSVAAVLQDDSLFTASLLDNLTLFQDNYDHAWLQTCPEIAQIDNDIYKLPMGYETMLTNMGSTFSGGQRQRLLLARALYRKPKILLLDEATSHVDPACEGRIYRELAALNMTTIVVAHRRETLQFVDKIISIK